MDMVAAQQRTMKEFLELYNRIAHHCFDSCISNFSHSTASGDETSCIDTCVNKFLNYNQRHMMVFVEHQNNKQKMAAKAAAEAQQLAVATPNTGEATAQGLAASLQQGSAPLVQPDTLVGSAAKSAPTAIPQSHMYKNGLTAQFMVTQPHRLSAYSGKSVVDRFLDSGVAEAKDV
ncbi:mitochondrial import inner membrane translocase subunit Tim10 B-like [Babylonia areolata]|uniref:mitochondrial import inner membrane translocase subunit Tim10 B-like n=1 Tax=Babylonia areolata TaxID=304850 RepID=UPI003FD3F1A5